MKAIITLIFLTCSLFGYAGDAMNLSVNPAQKEFAVKLQANPTTGYQWKVQSFDQKLLTLKSSQYLAPQTNLMGAGGTMVFTFQISTNNPLPSSTQLKFIYARPWEPNSGTVQKVHVQFETQSSGN